MVNSHPCSDEDARALRALTHLATRIRPDWDSAGVLTKVTEALASGRPMGPLAVATLRAAQDPANRTPAVIPLDGAHWRDQNAQKTETKPGYDKPKINGQPASIAELPPPGDYTRGAALARDLVREAVQQAQAENRKYIPADSE